MVASVSLMFLCDILFSFLSLKESVLLKLKYSSVKLVRASKVYRGIASIILNPLIIFFLDN